MSSLYEINEAIRNTIDLDTGEIVDFEAFEALQMERDEKIENIALWIKNLNADAAAYKAEKDSFAEKQRRAENKAESLKKYLDSVLAGSKFNTTRVSISYRKSTSVEVDESKLAAKWMREIPASYVVDKAEITKALKAGEAIEGAKLVENNNIQIK